MKKFSISMIKNTFLRRLCVILMIPIAFVAILIACLFGYVNCFIESLKDYSDDVENKINSLFDAIVRAWNGN